MSKHQVRVENGKYEFVLREGRIDVLRHGELWVPDVLPRRAIGALMAELDAARVVLSAVRAHLELYPRHDQLAEALDRHDQLVDDRESPSLWCEATGQIALGSEGHCVMCSQEVRTGDLVVVEGEDPSDVVVSHAGTCPGESSLGAP